MRSVERSKLTRPLVMQMRDRLMRFINRREKAYNAITKQGRTIPNLALKKQAIAALRIQLEASQQWGLKAHILWICQMRGPIVALLPYEFHDDPSQIKLRKSIIELLNFCDEQSHRKDPQLTLNQVA